MAQATRTFGSDLALFTVGGTALLAVVQNVSVRISYDMQEARALKDTARFRVPRIEQWEIPGEVIVDGVSPLTASEIMTLAHNGTALAVTLTSRARNAAFASQGTTYTVYGATYSGYVTITEATHEMNDGAQMIRMTLEGQGILTLAGS